MATDQNDVLVENVKDKGVITLNRPKALNALNTSMINKLYPLLKQWEKEKTLVIVKGAGGKSFCAGGDVKTVTESGLKGDRLLGQEFFRKEYLTNALIGTYNIPYIALIDGIVMGGGVGMSVHGRYRVATEKTLFAMPETQIGFVPDVGGSYFLPRLNGRLGYFLGLTGYRLKGSDVFKAGIATHYCESQKIPGLEKALLTCTTENDIKNTLSKFSSPVTAEFSLKPYMTQIDYCFGAPTVEEIVKRLEKDGSEWAVNTLGLLNKMCPTSLKVTLKELNVGSQKNLIECLEMEYRIAVNCMANKNFFEGMLLKDITDVFKFALTRYLLATLPVESLNFHVNSRNTVCLLVCSTRG